MYFIFLLLWIVLNGQFTWEILGFGMVISAALYWFCCRFLDYSPKRDLAILRRLPLIFFYVLILIKEIIKANVDTIRMVLSFRNQIDPVIVKFHTGLRTKTARVVLANSITLTPGTITIALEGDELTVHALDEDFAKGINENIFLRILLKIEAADGKGEGGGHEKRN